MNPPSLNVANFMKMACGDLAELRTLAMDFFHDTRERMTCWSALMETGEFGQLSEDLHRCKGGASLFGLERLVAWIGACENPVALASRGFDIPGFECELRAAETAVVALID